MRLLEGYDWKFNNEGYGIIDDKVIFLHLYWTLNCNIIIISLMSFKPLFCSQIQFSMGTSRK